MYRMVNFGDLGWCMPVGVGLMFTVQIVGGGVGVGVPLQKGEKQRTVLTKVTFLAPIKGALKKYLCSLRVVCFCGLLIEFDMYMNLCEKELIIVHAQAKILEDNKININQYNTTRMAEQINTRLNYYPLLLQKKGNQLLDLNDRTDAKKTIERKSNSYANHRNGANCERNNGHGRSVREEDENTTNRIEDDLGYLRRQIDSLDTYDQLDLKLRYQSQAFVLNKRRNNLFRGFDKKEENQTHSKQDRSIVLDNFINRKKAPTKNSLKLRKFLNTFMSKSLEEVKTNYFLQFISTKHKIPFEVLNKAPKLQIGYKQSDIRKISKYQININNLPPLGITFDNESKTLENGDDLDFKMHFDTADILNEEQDCYEERPDLNGYALPEKEIFGTFSDQKREIFKISRNVTRNKLEKESTLKRLAYHCVREVEKRYMRCIRNQNDYINRAKKLHRECLIYWRKREKELIELKKKKEKLEAQLKKRDEEEQQARKQEKRLQYIMYQSGLYSHFMATKLGVEGDHKKELDNLAPIGNKPLDIDEEAAMLSVNQIINNKMENLEKFDKKKDEKLDLSSVDQGRLELVGTPSSFYGTLKEYQIKGLRWLNNLFQQGINGILADEMGLGKTIQAIALLSHISENKGIWGPFLIVAPNSTLYNWQQQFKKFCPTLKVLPYWGNIKQRKTIRKFFSSKKFTERSDSPFHVVITSYQLTVTDEKTFKRLKWQFMILDEAQAIKNILSQRWNTLKQFQSRNRLLLTGTPIQNNMAELWALLNFVMPDLFDSHELFNEWFSKDIEAHSQDQKELDQIKIQRLHAILKPFMLRRIKKDVEHEIGKKYEHQILCEMTKRQKILYESIKEKLNVKELFKMFESKAKVENLMNLVMQLRKVCNHPELFERRPARSPFSFQQLYYYTGYIPIRAGEIKLLSSNAKNPIVFSLPKLIYDQLFKFNEKRAHLSKRIANIYTVDNQLNNPTFTSLSMTNFTPREIKLCFEEDALVTALLMLHWWKRSNFSATFSTKEKLHLNADLNSEIDYRFKLSLWNEIRSMEQVYMPNATAPLIEPIVCSKSFYEDHELVNNNKFQRYILEGKYSHQYRNLFGTDVQFPGIIHHSKSLTYIQVIDFGNLIADSSKLRELDLILKEKKKNGDKVLIFCQMTKMIDILEDFMNLRKYTFFRLDGASNIADRRDMVNDFQKPQSKVFVFLLSTRAGGLGVTLTAANTVIFYDNDWNPTMDAQATDRAHRIGQSRDVNVYQLVTKGTIEERIVKRAQQKKTVQSTVYEGASFNFFKKDMIIELMVDEFHPEGANLDEKLEKGERGKKESQQAGKKKAAKQRGARQQRQEKKGDIPVEEIMQNMQKLEMAQ